MTPRSGTYRFEVVTRDLVILCILGLKGRRISQTARTVLYITYMLPPRRKMAEHRSLTYKQGAIFFFLEQAVWLLHRKYFRLNSKLPHKTP